MAKCHVAITEAVDHTSEHGDIATDGWTMSHASLRLDFEDTQVVLNRMQHEKKIEDWEWEDLDIWWKHVHANVVQHHGHEEKYLFPAIYEKCCKELKERYSHSHSELMDDLKKIDEAVVKAIATKGKSMEASAEALKSVSDKLASSKTPMYKHFEEEERDMLPLFRKNFTVAEIQTIMGPMIAEFEWTELPHFYRQWGLDDQVKIKEHCTGPQIGMPGPVYDCVENLPGKFERYDIEIISRIEELKDKSKRAAGLDKRLKYESRGCGCTIA